jgi:hypothetical protein
MIKESCVVKKCGEDKKRRDRKACGVFVTDVKTPVYHYGDIFYCPGIAFIAFGNVFS